MAVIYDSEKNIFTLHTTNTTYQMKVDSYGYLLHLYYGPRTMGNMEYLLVYMNRSFSGNPNVAGKDVTYSLDVLPQEYPTLGTGDYRAHALNIADAEGVECCNLTFRDYEISKGKYTLPGLPAVWAAEDEADTLKITLRDETGIVEVQLMYGVLEKEDVITRAVIIKNTGRGNVTLKKAAAAALDFVSGDFDVISFYGKHNMERMLQRQPLGHGTFSVGSCRGTSSHQYNPGVILADREATEDAGSCYGMLFLYSGNFLCEVEKDQYNQTRFLMGLGTEQFDYSLASGEELIVPEAVLSYSAAGLSGLSRQYQSCIRDHVCRGKYVHTSRPVLINSWEANHFDFNGDTIVDLAKEAAALGIDMVVMDDGWFGRRNDDNSSLGDWKVNEEKLGGTLKQLIDRVHAEGVKFGIWLEPEMVNEDSDLYRAHPDWAIQIPGRKPVRMRNQLVLDFSRKEVRDAIYDQVCTILDRCEIDYVKWDMNRSLSDVYAGNVTYDYVLGIYEILEKIVIRYPNLLIEGCSGGGGRFDAGMMYYTPQIWCSDNTDAINRVKIQYGTSFFYPISVVGSHVTAVPNHQTGRSVSLITRGVVAMAGTFGYELNPALMSEEEKNIVKQQVLTYKKYESLICEGTYYRLSSPFTEPFAAWMSVSRDKKQALVSVVRLEAEGNAVSMYLKCKGLNPDAVYREENTGVLYDGAALMAAGLVLPGAKSEYEAYQFVLKEM
ncbi:alpha-galactosidase [Waltera sp.]|uniref:alpha-galactosidase n=1 Tax=Waltera sp. TaxID=2815806 RepID=UPI0030783AB3